MKQTTSKQHPFEPHDMGLSAWPGLFLFEKNKLAASRNAAEGGLPSPGDVRAGHVDDLGEVQTHVAGGEEGGGRAADGFPVVFQWFSSFFFFSNGFCFFAHVLNV